ncbi:GNAT family N-acetyltransferase [Sphingobium algorifonticola]|uniref:GNAT family N-acetyltransferase n=1 Tax=Sphingobium algorifonticola TaxID=2008318 RepID=A0A437JBD2_9SPHN|nr:GNAT family N-acetyltransferase [Sphingobium algorifonticola]RVT43184.1 GNAT family N-acetyltransferase [Sphingobium algorifonticola]
MVVSSPAGALVHRLAVPDDLPALQELVDASIDDLQRAFLTPGQIAVSRGFMGVDTRLVADGTYFIVARGDALAGCGGWSRRETPYGHDATPGRSDRLLDPVTEPARIRAMYTHPDHARQGVGRLILSLCEAAARAEGFRTLELSSTLAGAPLYHACGFVDVARFEDGGVPLITMRKALCTDA